MTATSEADVAWMSAELQAHRDVGADMERLLPGLREVGLVLCQVFGAGNRLYTFGNGGSAADAQHLAGELIGRFRRERRPLPAISLSTDTSVITCIGNDFAYDQVFARQVRGLVRPGDAVVAFTTSGRSPNVLKALTASREIGATTILLSSGDGGDAAALADHRVLVNSGSTQRTQEMHVLCLHLLSEMVDRWAEQTEAEERLSRQAPTGTRQH